MLCLSFEPIATSDGFNALVAFATFVIAELLATQFLIMISIYASNVGIGSSGHFLSLGWINTLRVFAISITAATNLSGSPDSVLQFQEFATSSNIGYFPERTM